MDITKLALSCCLGIIVTGATSWLVFGQDKVTEAEMKSYVQDQVLIEDTVLNSKISRNAETIMRLESSVGILVEAQQELLVEQRVLLTKFTAYLEQTK